MMEATLAVQLVLAVLIVCYLLSGFDDLAFDVCYWARRLFVGPFETTVRTSLLTSIPERRAAIFIPAWDEADVIAETLLYNGQVIEYDEYDIFVATYPNDPSTQRRVEFVAKQLHNVHLCCLPNPGPTTKADALNGAFAAMVQREEARGVCYDFVVLHDAEDVLHPWELRVVNRCFADGDADMIQTPIFPLPPESEQFTAGTYLDEFAEVQTKDLHVREMLGGFVPSCGVATGFRRGALEQLCGDARRVPFTSCTLTEDYEVALALALRGMRTRFVRQRLVDDLPPNPGAVRPVTPDPPGVATWGGFPDSFRQALRQRTRWSVGIVFQSRDHHAGGKSLVNRWLLFHDRKAAWAYPTVALGYLLILAWLGAEVLRQVGLLGPASVRPVHPWIFYGAVATLALLANRLLQRAIAVRRVYGDRQARLSVLRQPWDNILNICAVSRAAWQHYSARWQGRAVVWDKTTHTVPAVLRPRIGELMLRGGWITAEQIATALIRQTRTGQPLGEVLVAMGVLTPRRLDLALEAQALLQDVA